MLPKKQGRNERCACGSGKKYKQCCGNIAAIESHYRNANTIHTPSINILKYHLGIAFPKHTVKDLTELINLDTYVQYQKANFSKDVILVCERTAHSESLFLSRIQDPEANIMLFHQGKYLSFQSKDVADAVAQIKEANWISNI